MANEIVMALSVTGYKPATMSSAIGRSIPSFLASMAGNFTVEATISVGITATLIPLGQVTQPCVAFFLNKDATNFIRLMNGSGGAKLPKLWPGFPALFPLDDTSTPYAIADTAPCLMEYLIFSL